MTRRLVPLAILGVAAAYLWAATRVPLDPWSAGEAVNARTLPLACGALLALFAAGMSLRGVPFMAGPGRYGPLAAIVACIVAFIAAIPFAGLWPALGLFLCAALAVLGERRLTVLLGASIATPALGWVLVEVLLGVYIHPGSLWS
ncbi:MAG: tripartite tricarboxylate transporter TctB family protein [Gammaproteobacteria bacterium]|nr:tripartite tricarboxylate transporter TctB family protein [Gammaproteobacteria bacterium]